MTNRRIGKITTIATSPELSKDVLELDTLPSEGRDDGKLLGNKLGREEGSELGIKLGQPLGSKVG